MTTEKNQSEKTIPTETTGGGFKLDNIPIELEALEGSEQPEAGSSETDAAVTKMVNEAMIETAATVIGKVMSMISRIPEMNFDEEEITQLKDLWSPLVPSVSPAMSAIIGTALIISGKAAIYFSRRKELKGDGLKTVDRLADTIHKPDVD